MKNARAEVGKNTRSAAQSKDLDPAMPSKNLHTDKLLAALLIYR